jgi:hypothetical protein
MNKDLLLAILAMDSYNRGYGQHIKGLDDPISKPNATITLGNLRIDDQSDIDIDGPEFQAGFYAIKYVAGADDPNFAANTAIVSYRGTNPDMLVQDALNGYGLAFGSPYSSQTKLAIDWYKTFIGSSSNPFDSNAEYGDMMRIKSIDIHIQ